jgi:hypothetical protein
LCKSLPIRSLIGFSHLGHKAIYFSDVLKLVKFIIKIFNNFVLMKYIISYRYHFIYHFNLYNFNLIFINYSLIIFYIYF